MDAIAKPRLRFTLGRPKEGAWGVHSGDLRTGVRLDLADVDRLYGGSRTPHRRPAVQSAKGAQEAAHRQDQQRGAGTGRPLSKLR